MSHKRNHQTSNKGGVIAIMVTIVVTGGLVYLGLSKQAPATSTASSNDSMAGHHTSSGATTDVSSMVGKPAPDFSLTDHQGKTYALADLKGKNVVLFFNEGMMCYPACWNQIAALGQDARWQELNAVALSVVVDSSSEWNKAVSKMPELAQATVVHDNGAKVSGAYGMLKTSSSMHYGQLPGHTYVVIDATGTIRHAYDDPNMAIHNDQLVDELRKITAPS